MPTVCELLSKQDKNLNSVNMHNIFNAFHKKVIDKPIIDFNHLLSFAPTDVPYVQLLNQDATKDFKYVLAYPNLDFITNFVSNFTERCLCEKNPLSEKKDLSSGAVGSTSLISNVDTSSKDNKSVFVLKEIKGVKKTSYLSLRYIDISRFSKDFIGYESLEYNLTNFTTNSTDIKRHLKKGILIAQGDAFANQTCLHIILNRILEEHTKNFVYQYHAFYCGSKGYNIMELADLGDLSGYLERSDVKITDDLLMNILRQVLEPLSILKCKKYGFVHADLKCRNVFVQTGPDKKPIFKIADFDKSSIFWRGIRFYNAYIIDGNDKIKSLWENKKMHQFPKRKIANEWYYKLDTSKIQKDVMHNYIPMYMSYDIYTFMFSMMREPKIYEFLTKNRDSKFLSLWNSLWYMTEKAVIDEKLEKGYNMYASVSANTKPKILTTLRSLSSMNNDLGGMYLKINIDNVYMAVGLNPPSVLDKAINKFHENRGKLDNYVFLLTNEYLGSTPHLCIKPCYKSKCETNKHSKGNTGRCK